ncbi:MAG: hypothetical protein A2Z75_03120 [Chloroflexi bacterium RBG_13_50_10]|nr:MAG: hypothetical protein A2Z75_03120 [Chloroflexi bacterium RBG_13_50_10]
MNKAVTAAIAVAINAYMEQEEQARLATSRATPHPEASSWRVFGRQELMRTRTNWQVRRHNRRRES